MLLGFSLLHQVLDEHRLQLKNLAPASKCLRAVIIHQDESMFKGLCTFDSSSLDPSLRCFCVPVFNHSLTNAARHSRPAIGRVAHTYECIQQAVLAKSNASFIGLAIHVDVRRQTHMYTETSSRHGSDSTLSKSCSERSSTKYRVWLMSHFKLE